MPGRPDSVLNPILTAAQQEQKNKDLTAFSSLTPEQLAAQKNPPTWNDVFNAFNAQHQAVYGKEINRTWNTDQDTKNSKAAIDNLYQQGVDAWNKANNGNAKVDTTVLGVNVQPNSYTPDVEYHGIFGQVADMAKTLAPIGLAALGANFLGPVFGDLFGDIAGVGSVGSDALVTPTISGSVNQAIASGLAPGSAGAAAAASGGLTAAQLAAAAGVVTDGSLLSNIATLAPTTTTPTPGTTPLSDVVPPTLPPTTPSVVPPVVDPTALPPVDVTTPALPTTPYVPPPLELPPVTPLTPVVPPVVPAPYVPPPLVLPPVTPLPPVVIPPVTTPPGTTPPVVTPPVNTDLLTSLTSLTGLTGTQLAALLTGLTGAGNAANLTSAINTGLDATTAANTASQGVLKDIYNQQLGFQQPYQATGVKGLNQINQLADTGYLTHQFNAQDLAAGLAPNYDFMLQQGQMANQRAANVGGGALSGNTLQGLQKYTQDYAGNAYQNAFNNYQGQRQNIYNNLSGMAGIGQTANTGAQAAGTSYGKGTTDLQTALANAQAAASIGKAQALGQGTTGLANSTFLASLLGQRGTTA